MKGAVIIIAARCRLTVVPHEETRRPAEVRVAGVADELAESTDVWAFLSPEDIEGADFVYVNGVVVKDVAGAAQRIAAAEPTPAAAPVAKCPRCGGRLRLRRGQRGDFVGCSSFPECRFTSDDLELLEGA